MGPIGLFLGVGALYKMFLGSTHKDLLLSFCKIFSFLTFFLLWGDHFESFLDPIGLFLGLGGVHFFFVLCIKASNFYFLSIALLFTCVAIAAIYASFRLAKGSHE